MTNDRPMRLKRAVAAGIAGVSLFCAAAGAGAEGEAVEVLAPGWGKLDYQPPKPGTYDLPIIRPAAGGEVLRADGTAADLGDFLRGKISVLSFMYTSCDDINGCPLSLFVMHRLQDHFKKAPDLADNVRMISFSFDFEKDTPDVLRQYEKEHAGGGHAHHAGHGEHTGHAGPEATSAGGGTGGAEWLFVVAKSKQTLAPVLKAYSQFVLPEFNRNHEATGKFSHLLRVFLIDKQGRVRNIYSPSFLHSDVLLADIESLLMDAES